MPKAVGVFCGHRAYSSAGKNRSASALLLLHNTQHTKCSAQALLTSENVYSVGLKIFCKGYHNPHPIEIKMEPEESDLLKLQEQGSIRTGK